MSIAKLFYSDVTGDIYLDEESAKMAENAQTKAQLVSEVDNLRNEYNQEYAKLRSRYKPRFEALLQAIKDVEDKDN